MKLSNLLFNSLKESPKEAKIISHQLMLRSSMIRQHTSGIYTWLPLGFKVLKNIENIIRNNQDEIGCNEMLMSTIQSSELWKKSGRYADYGKEMLRITDRHDNDLLYGPTNEEVITDLFSDYVNSYKGLPKYLYHIQWKFRDEIRPRFGVMRGREFLMKDAYSFDLTEEAAFETYKKFFRSYLKTFLDLGLQPIPVKAATGDIGGDLSHEFQILANTGESELAYDSKLVDSNLYEKSYEEITAMYSASDEMIDKSKSDVIIGRGIEVGHIFHFGQKYSLPMRANITDKEGKNISVFMGSYGVGLSRLVGAVIEANHEQKGMIWPKEITPWDLNLINLKSGDDDCDRICTDLYSVMNNNALKILYDDTRERAGAKLARADLIGLPYQIMIGPKGIKDQLYDLKCRKSGDISRLSYNELLNFVHIEFYIVEMHLRNLLVMANCGLTFPYLI